MEREVIESRLKASLEQAVPSLASEGGTESAIIPG